MLTFVKYFSISSVVLFLVSGCFVQKTLTPEEISTIRNNSRAIQAEDRRERREYLQDRKEFELEGDRIYIVR